MRMLGRWAARSLPVPSELQPHLQRCVQMVKRIQDLEVPGSCRCACPKGRARRAW